MNNVVKIQQFDKPELKNYVERNLNYLTSKYESLATKMGNAQSVFFRTLKDAEDKELAPDVQNKIYESASKLRDKSIQKSLDEQIPVFQEIERLTEVYKKWHPEDPFLQENYQNIESGKNRVFNVRDEVDLQKKHREIYTLLRKNDILKKPTIPKYYRGKALTDTEKKAYSNIYWSEYIRILDMGKLLEPETIDKFKARIVNEVEADTPSGRRNTTQLQEMVNDAAAQAREIADQEFRQSK